MSRTTAVLGAIALVALSSTVEARGTRHHHRHHHHRHAVAPTAGGYDLSPWGDHSLVGRARSYLGKTAAQVGVRRTQWCSAFLRRITGAKGVDDRAISWIRRPHVAAAVGAIAVLRHHVGIVTGFDARGNPILVSGNHGHRVGEGVYPRSRVLAYVSAS